MAGIEINIPMDTRLVVLREYMVMGEGTLRWIAELECEGNNMGVSVVCILD